MKNAIKTKSFEEWLTLRASTVSSTESAALYGISPWVTEYELWHRKKNKDIVAIQENERMTWGKRLEEAIGFGVAEDNEWEVEHINDYFMKHRDFDLMGSSFDFFIKKSEFGQGILEIKNVDSLQFKDKWTPPTEDDEGSPPVHIDLQLQHQLEVADLDFGCVVALVGGNTIKTFFRKRNREMGNAILNKIKEFWKSIEQDEPPSPDFFKDSDFILSQYPFSEEGKVVDYTGNNQLLELCEKYKMLAESEKQARLNKTAVKSEIVSIVENNEKIQCGSYVINLRNVKPTSVSYERGGYRDFRIKVVDS